jgi:collagenase-like PrtC family protease
MHIVSPISRIQEVEPLAAAGADEFYCGILPRDWVDKFNTANANRRIFGNLDSYEDLGKAVSLAHSAGARMSLVLNAQHYTPEQLLNLVGIAKRFRDLGGDALIVSDMALIMALAEALPGFRLHLSSVASCRNGEAARLYHSLGIRRVILPRDVSIAEAAAMAAAAPEIEFEVFILNDGCVFEEGVCHTIHLPGKLGGPICLDNYSSTYYRCDGRLMNEAEARRVQENEADYKRWLWYRFSNGFTLTPEGLPWGPCGLCAIPALRAAGISAIKIAGREGATERKLASLGMVRQTLDRALTGASADAVADFARQLRKSPEHCATGHMCYYPEVVLSSQAEETPDLA